MAWFNTEVRPPSKAEKELPDDTIGKRLAVSDGFNVGVARWGYIERRWCHKENFDGQILFWTNLPCV